ncbi:hypothetical protein GLW08_17010 [Pontibacillus yanchengensis]|uniref:Uncharacterized protein n=1 Tax=Pontibacillus yanchengensis TaxID=462910 RepID=A0ACC7VK84_9BACI|nr:hypothetical protein [Pontibacillus yanchengensis]
MKFFLHHMALAWTGVFLILVTFTTITFRSLLEMFAYLNVYAAFIFILNRLIGTNHLFLASTPDVSTPLDILGSGVWYYINLELFCFGLYLGMYGLYRLFARKQGIQVMVKINRSTLESSQSVYYHLLFST